MSERKPRKRLGLEAWERLIGRWATAPDCPEKKLLVRVVAQAIADEEDCAAQSHTFVGSRWRTFAVIGYCRVLGIDVDFLAEQVSKSSDHFGLKAVA